ncbi:MAG: flagellar hook-basal body complex protein FliE [Halobacteriovoraceae bacterium]|nr:flagellar hook-basal body complex protein FliE [Halobacteriovoraceae bacterium]
MAVETIGQFNNMLNKFDSKSWIKSAELGQPMSSSNIKTLNELRPGEDRKTFGEMLAGAIGDVNDLQLKANEAIQKLATGKSKDIAETMLAVEQAEIAFKTMNQIRQKVVDAYKEIMRMQV